MTLRSRAFHAHGKTGCIEYRLPGNTSLFLNWWNSHLGTHYAVTKGMHGKAILKVYVHGWHQSWRLYAQKLITNSVPYRSVHRIRVNMLLDYSRAREVTK